MSERVGVSFSDWQAIFRTDKAKLLIVHESMQAGIAGSRVGYPERSTFGRVFRRFQGITLGLLLKFARENPELKLALASATSPAFVMRLVFVSKQNPSAFTLLSAVIKQLYGLPCPEDDFI